MHRNNPAPQAGPPPSQPDLDGPPGWHARLMHVIRREMNWLDGFLNRWLRRSVFLGMHASFLVAACYIIIFALAHGRTYDRLDDVPPRVCGLVLGCAPKVGDRENAFFKARVIAAAELYHEGKVQFLLVSGDNSRQGYNEPAEMKAALTAMDVPARRIYCDYAGFRTLDSIVRARKVFGLAEFTVISQRFHNERALYMARRMGLGGSVGYNASDASAAFMLKMHLREALARAMAILDVELLDSEPKFLGEKITIGEKTPPVD